MKLAPRRLILCLLLLALLGSPSSRTFAQSAPLNLWSSNTQLVIRDKSTLNYSITARRGYFEVYFDSNNNATWADPVPPYAIHTGGNIRIHGYLASPLVGGPYPAIVIGHGHHGHGSPEEAMGLAALGYVALSIDGPGQGLSTGPPDTEQGWISVERIMNVPAPYVSYQYHYAYAGMRALTLFEGLSGLFLNPFRIDRTRFGVIWASMGGQFTYYINGVVDRVKEEVGIAVAGVLWCNSFYPGYRLDHGLYYFKRTVVCNMTATDCERAINQVTLYYASQMDSRPSTVHDFGDLSLSWNGLEYVGAIPIGTLPPAGPPVTPDNIIYLASVKDEANYTVTSKLYYRSGVMAFGQGFLPIIEHYGDTLPVPPPPSCP